MQCSMSQRVDNKSPYLINQSNDLVIEVTSKELCNYSEELEGCGNPSECEWEMQGKIIWSKVYQVGWEKGNHIEGMHSWYFRPFKGEVDLNE